MPHDAPRRPDTRLLVRIDADRLAANLSLRLGLPVDRDRLPDWLRHERFTPVGAFWSCTHAALASLEPDEVTILARLD